MAQVSIPPSPAAMSTRRAPLSNLPNAINSTYTMSAAAAAVAAASMKRPRSQSAIQRERDVTYGQPPPKKQAIEVTSNIRTPIRRTHHAADVAKVVPVKKTIARTRPPVNNPPPAFADIGQQQQIRKATTSRATAAAAAPAEQREASNDDVRAWQKHYLKAFPVYVFFFENIPQDVLVKAQKQITTLGATCEKYFSAQVTHLITNRTLPNEAPLTTSAAAAGRWNSRAATVNPALIDQRGADSRKGGRGNTDILLKAREYGMKIWAVEKLDRILNVLFDFTTSRPVLTVTNPRNQISQPYTPVQQNDLSHLLRNEKLHGPTDRDPSVAAKDLHYWKGPFIYIHDMFGVNRPIIMREYPKAQEREEGTWPQFRSVSRGKCPFVEEHVHQRRERDRACRMEKVEKVEKVERVEARVAERERPKVVAEAKVQQKDVKVVNIAAPKAVEQQRQKQVQSVKETMTTKDRSPAKPKTYVGRSKRILAELNTTNSRTVTGRPIAPEAASALAKRGGATSRPENIIAFTATNESATQTARRSNVEPAASGVQPSNVTSAIRSQMMSSHQDQPGQRAGISKEIHALHRKVAGNVLMGNPVAKPATMARRSTDLLARAAENEARTTRRRDFDGRGKPVKAEAVVESAAQRVLRGRDTQVIKQRPKAEPKPGYCENCREKFEDFEEHTQSRQHRKFAANDKNWADLDDLLAQLRRPLKEVRRYR